MKSRTLLLTALLGSVLTCFSQDKAETRIIGILNTGETSKPAPAKPLPDFKVRASKTHRVDGRNVRIEQIEPPEFKEVRAQKNEVREIDSKDSPWLKNTPITRPMRVIAVSSTIYGKGINKLTRITLHYEKNNYYAWSNIDFRHLQGISAYKANGREYFILLGMGLARDDQGEVMNIEDAYKMGCPRQLAPSENNTGFIYTGDSERNKDPKALLAREILEDMHTLYRMEKANLRQAYHQYVKNQAQHAAELKANPPKKKDVTIRYWELSPEEIEKTRKQKTR